MLKHLLAQIDQEQIVVPGTVPAEVAVAFRQTWKTLEKSTQQALRTLGLFAAVPISQELLLRVMQRECDDVWELSTLTSACNDLIQHHLLQASGEDHYLLHTAIHCCLRQQLIDTSRSSPLKKSFCRAMAAIARDIPDSLTPSQIPAIAPLIPHLTEAATTWKDWLSNEDVAALFVGLGRFYERQGDYEQALPWYQDGLILVRDRLGQEHPDVAFSLDSLAGLYYAQRQDDMAELLYKQALEMRKRLFGGEHLDVALSLNHLATLYYRQGQYRLAEPFYRQALGLRKRLFGEEHPDVALSLNNLAAIYHEQGQFAAAEELAVEALAMRRRLFGDNHAVVALSLHNLAMLYESQNRDEKAVSLYREALAIAAAQLGEEHSKTTLYRRNLARVQARLRSPLGWLRRWWH